MSFLVKLHGVSLLPFAALLLMESFGMELPYIGCAAAFAGWDRSNPSLMTMTRVVAAFQIGESEFQEDTIIHTTHHLF